MKKIVKTDKNVTYFPNFDNFCNLKIPYLPPSPQPNFSEYAPDSTPRNDLYCYIAEGRGYYNHTVAEGEAGSWSDVEEERERKAFVNC